MQSPEHAPKRLTDHGRYDLADVSNAPLKIYLRWSSYQSS